MVVVHKHLEYILTRVMHILYIFIYTVYATPILIGGKVKERVMLRVHELDKEMSGEDRFHLENISISFAKGLYMRPCRRKRSRQNNSFTLPDGTV